MEPSAPQARSENVNSRSLVRDLNSKKWERHAPVERILANNPELALQVLQESTRKDKRNRKRYAWFMLSLLTCSWIEVLYGVVVLQKPFPSILVYYSFIGVLALIANNHTCSKATKCAASAIMGTKNLCAIGPFIDALNTNLERTAIPELTRLLPRLKASDTTILTASHWQRLYSILEGKRPWLEYNSDFLIAILHTLEQVGNSNVIPVVQKVADGEGAGKNDHVKQAAKECLIFLREATERQEQHDTLLRASGSETPSDMLLRPSGASEETQSDQLLRAANTE